MSLYPRVCPVLKYDVRRNWSCHQAPLDPQAQFDDGCCMVTENFMFGFGCIQFQLGVNEGASASFSCEPGP